MLDWSTDHVRCWLLNISLPGDVSNKFFLEEINGLVLQFYKEEDLCKDFNLKKGHMRLIVYFREYWLKNIERFKVKQDISAYVNNDINCSASFKSGKTFDYIIHHLKSRVRSFANTFSKANITEVKLRGDMCTSGSFESYFVEVVNLKKDNIIVGMIDRPPDASCDNFTEYLNEILCRINKENKIGYILGDFNMNLFRCSDSEIYFIDMLCYHLFYRLVNETTRITNRNVTKTYDIITNDDPNLLYAVNCEKDFGVLWLFDGLLWVKKRQELLMVFYLCCSWQGRLSLTSFRGS